MNFIKKILKQIKDGNALPCYILSKKPIIMISFWHDLYTSAKDIFDATPTNSGHDIYFLLQLGWHRETEERAQEIKDKVEELNQMRSDIHYTFLCNSLKEEKLLKALGLNAILCHQNSFVDTDYFPLIQNPQKEFDAIYVARITPFKRHQLAEKIEKLRLIGDYHDHEKEYVDKTFSILKQANWSRRVHFTSIYKELQKASTGLCLSEEEGAMFASIEYLLCGLPVVSTKNMGGRDFYFNNQFSEIVEADPDAVANAVNKLKALNIAPETIRQQTIEKMETQRKIFINIIQEIYDKEKVNKNFKDEWEDVFVHKFAIRTSMPWFGKAKKGRLNAGSFQH